MQLLFLRCQVWFWSFCDDFVTGDVVRSNSKFGKGFNTNLFVSINSRVRINAILMMIMTIVV